MTDWKAAGKFLRAIARDLNELGICTARGRTWYGSTASDQFASAAN
jgi:hypothetical protein